MKTAQPKAPIRVDVTLTYYVQRLRDDEADLYDFGELVAELAACPEWRRPGTVMQVGWAAATKRMP